MTEIEWSDAECEAVRGVFRRASFGPQDVLDTLAPHVAAREVQAAAKVLRVAAAEWQTGAWASNLPPAGANRTALILGMARRASDWLRQRADLLDATEAGESDGR